MRQENVQREHNQAEDWVQFKYWTPQNLLSREQLLVSQLPLVDVQSRLSGT